jgi:glycosyltransferase involved in cell wall biosynthesis
MRFVFISTMNGQPWGGSEELWSQAALRLHSEGHHVAAAVPWWPETAKPVCHLFEQGIEVFIQARPFTPFPQRAWRKLKSKILGRKSDPDADWLVAQKPDLVCVSSGGTLDGLHFLEICSKFGLPYVSVSQANAEHFWPADEIGERLRRVYHKALRTYFVSNRNRTLLETQLGDALTNAEIVRNPFKVSWGSFSPWPDAGTEWKLACVARLDPGAKGQDLLFQVLASDPWKVRPVSLSLVGSGPMERNLRRLVTQLELDQKVTFVGHVSDIAQVWAEHHALVLASRFEGLPLAVVEAMLCRRPVIVTDVAGNTELIENEVSGFIAAAPTASFVARAMESAWQRRSDWQEMGRAARQRAEGLLPRDPIGRFCDQLKSCLFR